MSNRNLIIRPDLSAVAIGYSQQDMLIANRLSPRTSSQPKKTFTWWEFDKSNQFKVPDSTVSRLGGVNQVTYTATEKTGSSQPYGLEGFVPVLDKNIGTPWNDEQMSVRNTTQLVLLDREIKVISKFVDSASYDGAMTQALTGTARWDNDASDPVREIKTRMDSFQLYRPNRFWMTRLVWTAASQHPKVVNAVRGVVATNGVASLAQFAALIEIDPANITIIDSWVDAAKFGVAADFQRLGGKCAGMYHYNPLGGISQDSPPTFATTVDWEVEGQRGLRVLQYFDPKVGAYGTNYFRVLDFRADIFPAKHLGYLWQTVIS